MPQDVDIHDSRTGDTEFHFMHEPEAEGHAGACPQSDAASKPQPTFGSVILLELNEINFDFVESYTKRGLLPGFRRALNEHDLEETTSEVNYERLEPWIQWVTAHTGKTFAEHSIFRLGDIIASDIPQIWETLETELGISVGAVCPMNAANRLKNPAFFVPDPWTDTPASGTRLLRSLSRAISQAVNNNAQAKLTARSLAALIAGSMRYATRSNWGRYIRSAVTSRSAPWRRAIFLDTLLSDVFFKEWKRTRPVFSSLFLNAGAHIQHHYLFSSACYHGKQSNPEWYIKTGFDPILEVYEAYDRILNRALNLPGTPRVLLATGLHQEPHDQLTYYWRLRNHAEFLRRIQVPFKEVHPRMSRDFLIVCHNPQEAQNVERILLEAQGSDGERIFSVDNRGTDLFVMLEYAKEINEYFVVKANTHTIERFKDHVAFVAIKNGRHDGIGYFIDMAGAKKCTQETTSLNQLFHRIRKMLLEVQVRPDSYRP